MTQINSFPSIETMNHVLEFQRLIPNSELHFIDKCGHAPMMEVPGEFNRILDGFLSKIKQPAATV